MARSEQTSDDAVMCDFDVALCMEERFSEQGVADGKAQGEIEGQIIGTMNGIKDSYSCAERAGSVLVEALKVIDSLPPEKASQIETLSQKLISAVNSPMSPTYLDTVLKSARNLERRLAIILNQPSPSKKIVEDF